MIRIQNAWCIKMVLAPIMYEKEGNMLILTAVFQSYMCLHIAFLYISQQWNIPVVIMPQFTHQSDMCLIYMCVCSVDCYVHHHCVFYWWCVERCGKFVEYAFGQSLERLIGDILNLTSPENRTLSYDSGDDVNTIEDGFVCPEGYNNTGTKCCTLSYFKMCVL